MDVSTPTHKPLELTGRRCRCAVCGQHFNSGSVFDLHRVGEYRPGGRRCLSEAEMIAKRYSKNAAGFWVERLWETEGRELAASQTATSTPAHGSGWPDIVGEAGLLVPLSMRAQVGRAASSRQLEGTPP
jgi:hypothetical protein